MIETNRVRVLFLFSEKEISDSNQKIVEFAELLSKEGVVVSFLLSEKENALAQFINAKNLSIEYLKQPEMEYSIENSFFKNVKAAFTDFWSSIKYSKKLARYSEMYSFDLVHSHGVYANLMTIFLRIRLNCALIWNAWDLPREKYGLILFLGSVFTDRLIFKSDPYEAIVYKELKVLGFEKDKNFQKSDAA